MKLSLAALLLLSLAATVYSGAPAPGSPADELDRYLAEIAVIQLFNELFAAESPGPMYYACDHWDKIRATLTGMEVEADCLSFLCGMPLKGTYVRGIPDKSVVNNVFTYLMDHRHHAHMICHETMSKVLEFTNMDIMTMHEICELFYTILMGIPDLPALP